MVVYFLKIYFFLLKMSKTWEFWTEKKKKEEEKQQQQQIAQ